MNTPPVHPLECKRLTSLAAHRILDTPQDQAFDDLTQLAAQICGVPIALLSLVDKERQWFKAKVGFDLDETKRDASFCSYAICLEDTLVVEDATLDERFFDNPFVTQPNGIRFYAGAKVCDGQGLPLGTLCVIDTKPRKFSPDQKRQLEQLASQAGRQLMLHKLLLELSEASRMDELTGLLNRRGLIAMMKQASVKPDQFQVVIYIDLNRFKPINDTFGHRVGDHVLKQVASRLVRVIEHETDDQQGHRPTVARVGGDEFVISLCTDKGVQWVQNDLVPMLCREVDQPIRCNGKTFVVTASVGIANAEMGQKLTPSEAISNADIAMYQAKHSDKQSMHFDAQMREQLNHEIEIEGRLRKAVHQGDITAVFEPIIDLYTGRVLGFETLARWTDPDLGKIRPDQFIPIAERTGLIDQIFQAVATQALATCRQVASTFHQDKDIWFSVNLSKTQLTDDRLFGQLATLIAKSGLAPHQLHLEVTESLVTSSEDMVNKLHRLRALGHPLMLDDFGTGTSSLSCLNAYPVQWIKIDRQLTEAADTSRHYAAIIQAVSDLTSNLGMNLVAEGVEHADTIPLLQGMNVSAAQGWYWSTPIAPDNLIDWLLERRRQGKSRANVA